MHNRDSYLLREIHIFFGVGNINEYENLNKIVYSVQSFRDLANVIIPHFDQYPLITQKIADYLLFKQAIELLSLNIQSDIGKLYEIIGLKAGMNSGLSDKLKHEFLNVISAKRPVPVVNFTKIPNPNWLAGFVDGEGCFYVNTKTAKGYLTGYQIIMSFFIAQHVRDELLLSKLIDYLGCGKIEKASTRPDGITFVTYKFSDIRDKIIPFFS